LRISFQGALRVKAVDVIRAKIQTVEEIYGLVWAAVANRRPIAASYNDVRGCFARTGWDGKRKANCVCCAIGTEEKAKADFSRRVRRPTGAALCWRSSGA
jgi:hypothetical protein